MPENDIEYFMRRASEERRRAVICEDNAAALSHLALAEAYDRRAAGGDDRVTSVKLTVRAPFSRN